MKFLKLSSILLFTLSVINTFTDCNSKRVITMTKNNKNLSSDFAIIGDTTFSFLEPGEDVSVGLKGSEVYKEIEGEVSIDKYQWGLDRIDQKSLPLDKNNYSPKYTGKNVTVYVLDTGVDTKHPEFEGRAFDGISYYGSLNDRHGHGTHVASTIIGKNVGVARGARVINVKVLGDSGSGSTINVVKGIEWSVNNYKSNNKECSIISMSLGGGPSSILDRAVDQAFKSGMMVVVSAGNNNRDAENYSPARAKNAITVGSVDIDDDKSSFSNYGKGVDIFAPGDEIIGAKSGTKKYTEKSGTSMSAPHVTGAVAQIMEEIGCKSRNNILKQLMKNSIEGVINNLPVETPNFLLQTENKESDDSGCPKLPCWVKCLMAESREDCESVSGCTCKWKSSRRNKCQIKN